MIFVEWIASRKTRFCYKKPENLKINQYYLKWQTLLSWTPKPLQMVTAATKLKDTCSLEEMLWQTYTAYWKLRHHFANKGQYSQSYGFSSSHVWMWELDNKKAEHQRIDAFKLWCWRRLLRVLWTVRRSNQSILKEVSPGYSFRRWRALGLFLPGAWFSSWYVVSIDTGHIAQSPQSGPRCTWLLEKP